MTVRLSNKTDVATTIVRGVKIELDCMTLDSILKIPRNFGLSDYVKEVWEEARYCKPLEITRKILYQDLGRETLPINLPRLMLRHIAYVINVPHHELPYGELLTRVFDAFEVPLDDKEGDEPVKTNFFEETFLNMSQLKRENAVWWLGSGANRRSDDEVNKMENEENEEEAEDTNEVEDKGHNQQANFDWEVMNEDVQVEGEQVEKEDDSESGEKFFDAMDDVEDPASVTDIVPEVIAPAPAIPDVLVLVPDQKKGKTAEGVDPSGPSGSMLDFDLLHLQAEFARALQRNTRFQELYQALKSKPPTSPKA
ncbi:hypothetical protein Dimus_015298 [Dionaea muscipula]